MQKKERFDSNKKVMLIFIQKFTMVFDNSLKCLKLFLIFVENGSNSQTVYNVVINQDRLQLQWRRKHGFDGFCRTHQFLEIGSRTHQFLSFSAKTIDQQPI